MLEIYKTKAFERYFRKEQINNSDLSEAIKELLHSNIGGLGHKLHKTRIASPYKGKRGSYRAITYYKSGERIIFLHLYAKNEKENITPNEMKGFILLSRDIDRLTNQDLQRLVTLNEFVRYSYEDK